MQIIAFIFLYTAFLIFRIIIVIIITTTTTTHFKPIDLKHLLTSVCSALSNITYVNFSNSCKLSFEWRSYLFSLLSFQEPGAPLHESEQTCDNEVFLVNFLSASQSRAWNLEKKNDKHVFFFLVLHFH